MKTPIRALARASVSETTPTIPARTATTIENKFGLSMRLETGRTPSEYNFGVCPDQRIARAKSRVTIIAAENPASRASRPRIIGRLARLSMPRRGQYSASVDTLDASRQVISTSSPVSTGHFGHGQQFCFARKQASLLVTSLLPRLT